MILLRQKYPRGWFDRNLQQLRFANRIGVYLALTHDRYPSTDAEQSVHPVFDYRNARDRLNRRLPPINWLLYIEGVMRWRNRVVADAFILVTDVYPPVRMSP